MYLVHKEDCATAQGEQATLGSLYLAPEVLHSARDGRDLDKLRVRRVSDDARKRGLARAGRAVENHRGERVVLDCRAKPAAGTNGLGLAHVFLEGLRTHARGERGVHRALVALYVGEEVVHASDCSPGA